MSMLKKNYRFLLVVGLLCGLAITVAFVRVDTTHGATTSEEYKQKVRNALAEVNFPTSLNQNEITSATRNLSDFMYYRSGTKLNQSNKSLLASAEGNFWNNNKRIDPQALTGILVDLAKEQTPQLSNAEIVSITDAFRGFNGLPPSFANRDFATLRASGRGEMPFTEFSNELTSLRDGAINAKIAQSMIYLAVDAEVSLKTKVISDSDPNFFSGPSMRMTPLQAVLVAYAVITDDQLLYNRSELEQRMASMQTALQQYTGRSYPSPNGYRAYGDNGYIFSSPAQTILNDTRIARLITLIQEKGN